MKPIDFNSSIYFDFDVENNDEDTNSKVGHMWEYQNIK